MSALFSGGGIRGLAAEFVATFTFVFMGIGALGAALSLASPIDGAGLIIVALGHGLGIFLGIVVMGRITGAHLNPVVTFAMVVSGNIALARGLTYIVGQLAGAILAALALDAFTWGIGDLGVHRLGGGVSVGDGLMIEIILTFFLVFTIFATAVDRRGSAAWAPLAIGMVVFVDHLIAVPLTGASMNPARSFGPALVHGVWIDHWLYWVGPAVGALTAVIAYVMIFGTKEDQERLGTIAVRSV